MKPDDIANMGVSRTFQNIELFENMTALDNILIGAHKHINYGAVSSLFRTKKVRIQEDEARNIAEDVIDFLEIEEHRFSYILSLPYGIQKRIELGRALAMKPDVLLLDEPAAGLNTTETASLKEFLLELSSKGITLLLVDHDMPFINSICQEVSVMNFGQLIYDGNISGLRQDKKVLQAYLGVDEEQAGDTNA